MPRFYDNPAGRLHAILTELHEVSPQESIVGAWGKVLGVPTQDVILRIGTVADLVRQIQDAVDEIGDPDLSEPVERLRDEWSKPMFSPQHALNVPLSNVLLSPDAMQSLALVSRTLHLLVPEGRVPDVDGLDGLKEQVRGLVDGVRIADDLPDDVKQAIVGRLKDVERAIEHIHVGGPKAVQQAMESVMGTALRAAATDPQTSRSPSMQVVVTTLLAIWIAFSSGDEIQKNLVAWPKVAEAITTGKVVESEDGDEPDDDKRKTPETKGRTKPEK